MSLYSIALDIMPASMVVALLYSFYRESWRNLYPWRFVDKDSHSGRFRAHANSIRELLAVHIAARCSTLEDH